MPVIVSNNCGSVDLVNNEFNGYIFDPDSAFELETIIKGIDDNIYQKLKGNIAANYIESKDLNQIDSYL